VSLETNPVLVNHTRGGIVESFHRGVVCVADAEGTVVASVGDIQQVCYPRSALKFFQHIPLIASGAFDHFGFTLKELALMCGSHNGEEIHVETAMGILAKIGMGEESLGCGAQQPTHKKDFVALIKATKSFLCVGCWAPHPRHSSPKPILAKIPLAVSTCMVSPLWLPHIKASSLRVNPKWS